MTALSLDAAPPSADEPAAPPPAQRQGRSAALRAFWRVMCAVAPRPPEVLTTS